MDKNYTEVRDCTEWYWKYIYNNRDVQMNEYTEIRKAIWAYISMKYILKVDRELWRGDDINKKPLKNIKELIK